MRCESGGQTFLNLAARLLPEDDPGVQVLEQDSASWQGYLWSAALLATTLICTVASDQVIINNVVPIYEPGPIYEPDPICMASGYSMSRMSSKWLSR